MSLACFEGDAISETKYKFKKKRYFLTLEMVRGMLKSFPPCSLKPQGPGPGSDTV